MKNIDAVYVCVCVSVSQKCLVKTVWEQTVIAVDFGDYPISGVYWQSQEPQGWETPLTEVPSSFDCAVVIQVLVSFSANIKIICFSKTVNHSLGRYQQHKTERFYYLDSTRATDFEHNRSFRWISIV